MKSRGHVLKSSSRMTIGRCGTCHGSYTVWVGLAGRLQRI